MDARDVINKDMTVGSLRKKEQKKEYSEEEYSKMKREARLKVRRAIKRQDKTFRELKYK